MMSSVTHVKGFFFKRLCLVWLTQQI